MILPNGLLCCGDRNRVQVELVSQNLRSQVLANITLKIRQSLQIEQILQTPNS
ncbi:hypothetical protein [Nostoc sp.]|uniref:hypothetical protein n=1 Tax=Nostoc sp. TaxID=1180 RepID=UPI002FF5A9FF